MKARTSKQILEAIAGAHAIDPAKWGLYHSAKWLAEEIEVRRSEIRQFAKTTIGPVYPGESHAVRASSILHRLVHHQHPLHGLESVLRAVETDAEFEAAKAMFTPLYEELDAALFAEEAEIAALQAEAEEITRKAEKAEAEAQAKIAAARGPVEKLLEAGKAICNRITEIRG